MNKYFYIIIVFIILITLSIIVYTNSKVDKYKVEYNKDSFKSNKKSNYYKEGENVKLIFYMIATDTDYEFIVNGVDDYNINYNDNEGYVITFKMPNNNVEVDYNFENTMIIDR